MSRRIVAALVAGLVCTQAGCGGPAETGPNPNLEVPKSTTKPEDVKGGRSGLSGPMKP